jgi:hypothetical protein
VNAEEKLAEKEAGREDVVPTDEAAKEKEGVANEAEKEEEDKVVFILTHSYWLSVTLLYQSYYYLG